MTPTTHTPRMALRDGLGMPWGIHTLRTGVRVETGRVEEAGVMAVMAGQAEMVALAGIAAQTAVKAGRAVTVAAV